MTKIYGRSEELNDIMGDNIWHAKQEIMGKNEELGLPFGDGMEKVAFCFDVDGTLIENEATFMQTLAILQAMAFQKWKNVDIIVWSGGGKDYARTIVNRISAELDVKFYSKLQYKEVQQKYDFIIAVDDIQDTRLGDVNLIVRNK